MKLMNYGDKPSYEYRSRIKNCYHKTDLNSWEFDSQASIGFYSFSFMNYID